MVGDDMAREIPWVGGGTLLVEDDVISVDGDEEDETEEYFPPPRMASRQEQQPPIIYLSSLTEEGKAQSVNKSESFLASVFVHTYSTHLLTHKTHNNYLPAF
jgi:hypothetical protein